MSLSLLISKQKVTIEIEMLSGNSILLLPLILWFLISIATDYIENKEKATQ